MFATRSATAEEVPSSVMKVGGSICVRENRFNRAADIGRVWLLDNTLTTVWTGLDVSVWPYSAGSLVDSVPRDVILRS